MAEYRYRVTTGRGRAQAREKGSRFLAWVELGPATYGELVRCTLSVVAPRRPDLEEQLAALGIEARQLGDRE